MPLRAGKLNRRVTIQKPVVGSDSEGSPKTTWAVLDVVSAQVDTLSARERVAAAQAQLDLTDSVTIHWRDDMMGAAVHNYRLLLSTRILEIKEVIPDERHRREITLLCQEMSV